eukprot:CAMPEP_0117430050 /NCGR_PEP_ID=MMETSP0758-20121206/9573_1 /TAXON_ID=63605 /ORGANISM="Percolomonas cosmopolitus, Strain AE-1 (ATCC 50343)" /LENGTH=195 /DNA_ID=CAMNT_0005217649 /DNA_START=15 /DNA_END=599 /DNA_ORIENTATION=-
MAVDDSLIATIITENKTEDDPSILLNYLKSLYESKSGTTWSNASGGVMISKYLRENEAFTFHKVSPGKHRVSLSGEAPVVVEKKEEEEEKPKEDQQQKEEEKPKEEPKVDKKPVSRPPPVRRAPATGGYDVDEEIETLLKIIKPHCKDDKITYKVIFDDDDVQNSIESISGTLKAAKRKKIVAYGPELLLQGMSD